MHNGRHGFALFLILAGGIIVCLPLPGQEIVGATSSQSRFLFAPDPVTEEDFIALKTHSPFLRPLDLSRSLVLTGIAQIEGELIATLFDKETKETHLVSSSANPKGWQMVSIEGDRTDLETVTAQISAAGQVFSVRFDQSQLNPDPKAFARNLNLSQEQRERVVYAARNYRQGFSGDGFRGPPPPEVMAKLSRLSQEQREQVIGQITEMRNRRVSSEERQRAYLQMLDRALQQRR